MVTVNSAHNKILLLKTNFQSLPSYFALELKKFRFYRKNALAPMVSLKGKLSVLESA